MVIIWRISDHWYVRTFIVNYGQHFHVWSMKAKGSYKIYSSEPSPDLPTESRPVHQIGPYTMHQWLERLLGVVAALDTSHREGSYQETQTGFELGPQQTGLIQMKIKMLIMSNLFVDVKGRMYIYIYIYMFKIGQLPCFLKPNSLFEYFFRRWLVKNSWN